MIANTDRIIQDVCEGNAVTLDGVTIEEPLNLSGKHITTELTIRNATFRAPANFSYARFEKRVNLSGSLFERGANFDSAHFESDVQLKVTEPSVSRKVRFCQEANFIDVRVDGIFDTDSVVFANEAKADFTRARLGRSAFFVNAKFTGEANFTGASVEGNVTFDGAELLGSASFDRFKATGTLRGARHKDKECRFAGNVGFVNANVAALNFPAAIFEGEVDFEGICVTGSTIFNDAEFKHDESKPKAKVSFYGANLGTKAHFLDVDFRRDVSFQATAFGMEADFSGATFHKAAEFDGCHIAGTANFDGVTFCVGSSFASSKIDTAFRASGTTQDRTPAAFHAKTDWTGAYLGGDADFCKTQFDEASFQHTQFSGGGRFEGAVFNGLADFQFAKLDVLTFTEADTTEKTDQFVGPLNLKGCSYQRMEAHWPTLKAALENAPFDRQPYTQYEQMLRTAGEVKLADSVYIESRKRERRYQHEQGNYLLWLKDWLYGLLLNWGVRPFRLLLLAVVLLVINIHLLSQPNTVALLQSQQTPIEGVANSQQNEANSSEQPLVDLNIREATELTLAQFVPLVTIPAGTQWVPAERPTNIRLIPGTNAPKVNLSPALFCTITLRLAGIVLIPLGVAALTGVLRRTP